MSIQKQPPPTLIFIGPIETNREYRYAAQRFGIDVGEERTPETTPDRCRLPGRRLASRSDVMPPPVSVIVTTTIRIPGAMVGIPVAVSVVISMRVVVIVVVVVNLCRLSDARSQQSERSQSQPKNATFPEHIALRCLWMMLGALQSLFKLAFPATSIAVVLVRITYTNPSVYVTSRSSIGTLVPR